ncbi:YqzE-like protein [Paenibacillus sp. UNCCL117]|uniref:YqzE family protein n=1 Tax=unclassified Paenibacillus TaxID=185978 RepID=UPI00088D73DA|nr:MULTISPECIES: YqzE family protein [unclassified Paenibacillus]SDC25760.1 YqzE-like protein [Paenibacillus sp. cl123]SFW19904.1 YqzE-like protein [Paenibacillus sp. UNCCL117]
MGKSDELVKYVTERVVRYIDTPREVRRQVRAGRKEAKEPWEVRWFGMLPLSIRMWRKRWLGGKDSPDA